MVCRVYKYRITYLSLDDGLMHEVKFTSEEDMKDYIEQLKFIGIIDSNEDVSVYKI